MQAADGCMKRQDKRSVLPDITEEKREETLQKIREEIFLYVWVPVLTEYVEWVLKEAVRSGKKRLYFLARDGFMMYGLAEKLVKERKIDLDLRYLKISRFAVRNAEYCFAGKEALHTLCSGGIDVSFETIMKRANLTEGEARHIAELTGYTKDYKTALNYRRLCSLKKELYTCDRLFAYIQKHAKGCYDAAVSYFRQEGLLEDIPYALVDSGWVGTLQLSLQKILEHAAGGKIRLQGYYFGLYARPAKTGREQYKAFYFGEKEIVRKIRFSNCLFETVFSAPEGMTCGYGKTPELLRVGRQEDPGPYQALESSGGNPNMAVIGRFAELLAQYADQYMKYTAPYMEDAAQHMESRKTAVIKSLLRQTPGQKMCKNLLSHMMGDPALWEAEAFGSMLFCDDVLELQLQQVAAVWDEEELRKQRFFNRLLIKMNLKCGVLHESAWAEGSIARLGGKAEKNMRQERLYKGFMYVRKAVFR